jgi:hypothetical protein
MRVYYTSDNAKPITMSLEMLIRNFNDNDGWFARHSAEDMTEELTSRGWYEGLHINGHYLVLNLDKLQLEPRQ